MLKVHQSAQVTTHSHYTSHRKQPPIVQFQHTVEIVLSFYVLFFHLTLLPSSLQLSSKQAPLVVKHFLYTAWPDHGVPQYSVSIHRFIRQHVRPVYKDSSAPLIVHCRWGEGWGGKGRRGEGGKGEKRGRGGGVEGSLVTKESTLHQAIWATSGM